MRYTPDLPKEACKDKGKHKVFKFEIGTCSKPSVIEELNEREDLAHQKVMESLSKVEVLKKSLQYFKDQNWYLNDSNEKLMIENKRRREDLEDIYASYQELITTSKEVLRRKRLTQQLNEEFISHNKELQTKVQTMYEEYYELQKRSLAFDGLKMLAEASKKLWLIVFE